jgi:hypothetical protein
VRRHGAALVSKALILFGKFHSQGWESVCCQRPEKFHSHIAGVPALRENVMRAEAGLAASQITAKPFEHPIEEGSGRLRSTGSLFNPSSNM